MYADFSDWLRANDFDPEAVTAAQKLKLQAQWRAEEAAAPPAADPPAPAAKADDAGFTAKMEALEAENRRIESIRAMTLQACQNHRGNPAKVSQFREMCEAAVADERTTVKDYQLALMRADRFTGNLVVAPAGARAVTADVVEAAVCRNLRLPGIERHYAAETLDAVDRNFRGGLSLQDAMGYCARRAGWRGSSVRGDLTNKDFLRAAFGRGDGGGEFDVMAGSSVPSTYSLPNIMANVANKFLRVGFDAVDASWRAITAIRSVPDFKQTSTVALHGHTTFKKVAPGGQIKDGTLSELSYTNQADTYAIKLGIDRRDMINDDAGALARAGVYVGRGAATKLADLFWTEFLNNSSFFTSGNNNVSTGAGSALAAAGLKTADQKFRVQTDPEGLPIGSMPRFLVVPPTLWYTARELMNSSLNVGTTTANALLPATNIFQGAYQIVTSPYMENSSYTGYSTAAWYLLADPQDIPVIEGVFVGGRDTPMVETAELDFDMLGVAMRGWIDAGFNLQEFRGGVRSAGS